MPDPVLERKKSAKSEHSGSRERGSIPNNNKKPASTHYSSERTSPSAKPQRYTANKLADNIQPNQPVPTAETVSRVRDERLVAQRLRSSSIVDTNTTKSVSAPFEKSDPLTMNKSNQQQTETHSETIDMNVFTIFAVSAVVGLPAITWALFAFL